MTYQTQKTKVAFKYEFHQSGNATKNADSEYINFSMEPIKQLHGVDLELSLLFHNWPYKWSQKPVKMVQSKSCVPQPPGDSDYQFFPLQGTDAWMLWYNFLSQIDSWTDGVSFIGCWDATNVFFATWNSMADWFHGWMLDVHWIVCCEPWWNPWAWIMFQETLISPYSVQRPIGDLTCRI